MGRSVPAKKNTQRTKSKLRYEVVYDLVNELIVRDGLQAGAKLPSSNDLVRMAGVSLISVRHALDKLENEGRIERQQGVGTFVARGKIVSEPGRSGGLLKTLAAASEVPALVTELLSLTVGIPSPTLAKALSLGEGQPTWDLRRLRRIGTTPTILEQAVLPVAIIPSLSEAHLAAGLSLYEYLADVYNLVDFYSEQVIEVAKPNASECEMLNLGGRERVVRIRGLSSNADNVVFDCWCQTYKASDFVFYSSGSGGNHLLQPLEIGSWEVKPLTRS